MMLGIGPIGVLICCGAMALVGITLIKVGRWPRRHGGRPRCAKCDYLVVGISSERCPECGSILAGKGTVFGPRVRSARLWVSGVIILIMALAWGGPYVYRSVAWYHLKPARWVMSDLESRKLSVA